MRHLLLTSVLLAAGCTAWPQMSRQPRFHNPFPQLARVAVAPFFNLTPEPTVDGRQFAAAYYSELQSVPGFEVVPVGVVEQKIMQHRLSLGSAEDARKLAQLLDVDAVVVGAVTDFTPYYPPRCALRVEWYAADPNFCPILPGYGLPWGTPQAEEIPDSLIFATEMAQAQVEWRKSLGLPAGDAGISGPAAPWTGPAGVGPVDPAAPELLPAPSADEARPVPPAENPATRGPPGALDDVVLAERAQAKIAAVEFAQPLSPACAAPVEPVLRHTRSFQGTDPVFTAALEQYYRWRCDERSGGWKSYLQRSDDFIRFCCYLHVAEMLTARGGADEARVVWRWSDDR